MGDLGKKYKCVVCNIESIVKEEIMKHEQKEHSIYRCHLCKTIVYNDIEYFKHMNNKHGMKHGEFVTKYRCDQPMYCDKIFTCKLVKKAHYDTDIKHMAKPIKYHCDLCDFCCHYKEDLKAHTRMRHCKTAI